MQFWCSLRVKIYQKNVKWSITWPYLTFLRYLYHKILLLGLLLGSWDPQTCVLDVPFWPDCRECPDCPGKPGSPDFANYPAKLCYFFVITSLLKKNVPGHMKLSEITWSTRKSDATSRKFLDVTIIHWIWHPWVFIVAKKILIFTINMLASKITIEVTTWLIV